MHSMHAECELDATALLLFSIEVLIRFSRLLESSAATVGGKQAAWRALARLSLGL